MWMKVHGRVHGHAVAVGQHLVLLHGVVPEVVPQDCHGLPEALATLRTRHVVDEVLREEVESTRVACVEQLGEPPDGRWLSSVEVIAGSVRAGHRG